MRPITPLRWRSGSAPPAVAICFRPTSRSGSTSVNDGSSPASSGSGILPRPTVPGRSPRTHRIRRSRIVTERRPVGFGRRDDGTDKGAPGPTDERPWPEGVPKLDEETAIALLPKRPERGHKGSFGKLLVLAGSLDYAGAGLLVCRAAGRAGVGLVTLAVPETLQPLFAAKVVEATTMALPEDDVEELDPEPSLARILDHDHDAIVIGPGLRPGLATAELVRQLLAAPEDGSAPIVLDAEALRSLATMDHWWEGDRRASVLTPH